MWELICSDSLGNLSENVSKRSSHTLNFINSKIYVFGGEHIARYPINNNLLVFDAKENKWSEIESPQAPSPRMGHSSCSLKGTLFIFGGRTGIDMNETSLNDLYSYDVNTNTWTLLCPGGDSVDLPVKRSYHTMAALKNKLYIFGGCSTNHGRLNDLYEFDLEKRKWTRLPGLDKIAPRGGSSLCAYESLDEAKELSCLYLIGGFCGHELDDCFRFEIKTQKWEQIESLPRKLSVFACSSVGNRNSNVRLILHGGEVDPSTVGHNGAGEFSSDTYIFDGNKWKFVDTDQKPSSRGWHASCLDAFNSKLYIYGGNLENNERTNELWCFSF